MGHPSEWINIENTDNKDINAWDLTCGEKLLDFGPGVGVELITKIKRLYLVSQGKIHR